MKTKARGSKELERSVERRKRRTMSQSDMLEFWTDHGFLIPQRVIQLTSAGLDSNDEETGVDALMFRRFDIAMSALEYFDPRGPITIIMNNPGGDYYHGMAIYDRIMDSPCIITIKCYGYVMSAGSLILQAANRRLMARHSTMMLHYGTDGFDGHSKDLERRADEAKRINLEMEDIYLQRIHEKNPEYSRKNLKDDISFDCYLDASKAIRIGLADGFVSRPAHRRTKKLDTAPPAAKTETPSE